VEVRKEHCLDDLAIVVFELPGLDTLQKFFQVGHLQLDDRRFRSLHYTCSGKRENLGTACP
jgi:hypothetical protein